jgi:hypothetical protein
MEILLTDYGLHSRSLRLNPRQEPNTDNKTETSLTRVATILLIVPQKQLIESR